MPHDVFICHASEDKIIADSICFHLEKQGVRCWIAPRDILAGTDFGESIHSAISKSKVMVVVFSENTNASKHSRTDITIAISEGINVIPFRIDNVIPSGTLDLHLKSCHWINAFPPPTEHHFAKLVDYIQKLLPSPMKRRTVYDVFISYRRDMDSQTARLIRSELQQHRFQVFLDVDDLRPGHFDESLLMRIQEAPSFVVILSAGSLERCYNSDDWLRREIVCALENNKVFIPIIMPGFNFPTKDDLPEDLHLIPKHHGISYSHEYFNSVINKLVSYLGSPQAG